MTINLTIPDIQELKPRITVFGVGGAGGNAVNNMIASGLSGVDFVCANTDAQALALSSAQRIIQLGVSVTEGLGAGSHPEVGRAAAEESYDEINDHQRRYTTVDLREKLLLHGFAVKRLSYNNFFLFPPIAALRMLRPYQPQLESPHLTQDEEVYQVEMEPIPEPANTLLHGLYWAEAELLQRIDLPFGVSVICIAEKPASAPATAYPASRE